MCSNREDLRENNPSFMIREIRIAYFALRKDVIENHNHYNYSKDGEGISFEFY